MPQAPRRPSTQNDLNFLRRAPGQMSQLRAEYRQAIQFLRAEKRYIMPAEYQRRVEQAKAKHEQAITALQAGCQAARMRLQETADLARGEGGRGENLARVLLSQQAWQRIKPILERERSQGYVQMLARVRQFAEDAGRTGDLGTLWALKSELNAWLEASEPADQRARRENTGVSFTEFDNTARMLGREVNVALTPWVSEDEQIGMALDRELERYPTAIDGNIARLRADLDDEHGAWSDVGLMGWSARSYVRPGETNEIPPEQQGLDKE